MITAGAQAGWSWISLFPLWGQGVRMGKISGHARKSMLKDRSIFC
jgi:hypothetical protein